MDGATVRECRRCPGLVASREQIVNGVGPESSPCLFLGEAPGASEDQQGEPFVGRSGQLLTDALSAVGLDRTAVRITNCVRCRPPDNRNPKRDELEHCSEWLERELEVVDPDVVVPVGKVPASELLERDVSVTKEAGRKLRVELAGRERTVVVSVHPAAVLYDRSNEARLEAALETVATTLGLDPSNAGQAELADFGADQ